MCKVVQANKMLGCIKKGCQAKFDIVCIERNSASPISVCPEQTVLILKDIAGLEGVRRGAGAVVAHTQTAV